MQTTIIKYRHFVNCSSQQNDLNAFVSKILENKFNCCIFCNKSKFFFHGHIIIVQVAGGLTRNCAVGSCTIFKQINKIKEKPNYRMSTARQGQGKADWNLLLWKATILSIASLERLTFL